MEILESAAESENGNFMTSAFFPVGPVIDIQWHVTTRRNDGIATTSGLVIHSWGFYPIF